jgi:hypothetical protein
MVIMSNINLTDVDLYELLGVHSTAATEEVSGKHLLYYITGEEIITYKF